MLHNIKIIHFVNFLGASNYQPLSVDLYTNTHSAICNLTYATLSSHVMSCHVMSYHDKSTFDVGHILNKDTSTFDVGRVCNQIKP